jgi:hypothetical protein
VIIRLVSTCLLLLAQLPLAAPASTCAGANPAVTSAVVKSVVPNGHVNQYNIQGTITNLGAQGQAANTLQFVDIYEGASQERLNDRGIPPLKPGQTYQFGYVWNRSIDAGQNSTTLEFRVRMVQGTNCNPSNAIYKLTL